MILLSSLNLSAQKIYRTFKWTYGDYVFTKKFEFLQSDYDYYHGLKKNNAVPTYVKDHVNHEYLLKLAKTLDKDANGLGYTRYELAEYIIAFVQQSTHYKSDPSMVDYGGGNYCKHPIETLVERGGDCEDKAILLVALLKTFGFGAVLLHYPHHYAVGFDCDGCSGTSYSESQKKYYYIETTSNSDIGIEPEEYSATEGQIIHVAPLKRYIRNVIPETEKLAYAELEKKKSIPYVKSKVNNENVFYNENIEDPSPTPSNQDVITIGNINISQNGSSQMIQIGNEMTVIQNGSGQKVFINGTEIEQSELGQRITTINQCNCKSEFINESLSSISTTNGVTTIVLNGLTYKFNLPDNAVIQTKGKKIYINGSLVN